MLFYFDGLGGMEIPDFKVYMKKNFVVVVLLIITSLAGCRESRQKPVFEYTLTNPATNGSRFPNFHQDQSGANYLSWVANVEENIYMFRYSKYTDEGWHEPETIHIGSDYYVHWADLISVVGIEGQPIASHRYVRPENSDVAYQAELLFRNADTRRWDDPVVLSSDQTPSMHGFVSLEPLSEDAVLAVWLEGGSVEGNGGMHSESAASGESASLRSAVISADGEQSRNQVIDDAVFGCSQNDLVATQYGNAVVYRGEGDSGDVRIAHYDADSAEWSTPEVVHNTADNTNLQLAAECPAEGPRADSNGSLTAVVWYSEADENRSVYLARSVNRESGFQQPIRIAESEHQPVGRTDVVVTDNGDAYVSWMRQTGDQADIMLTHVDAEGSVQETRNIGTTTASTSSGIPRMGITEEAIIVAWTQTAPVFRVRTVRFPL